MSNYEYVVWDMEEDQPHGEVTRDEWQAREKAYYENNYGLWSNERTFTVRRRPLKPRWEDYLA